MNPSYINAFESYIKKVESTYNAQGLIVGIFDKKNILYENTLGYRDVKNKKPITKDTIFGIASITKSFTVIGLLQLAAQGIIDIEAPVSQYYHNWDLELEHTPTIKHLMSHAGGFFPQERFLMNDFAERLNLVDESDHFATNEILAKSGAEAIVTRLNQETEFTGAPGDYMSYSNFSFGLLTDLVYRFSSHPSYAQAIEEDVIHPIGLENTFFDFTRPKAEENITKLYEVKGNEIKETMDYTDLGFVLIGGGGIKSSFNDMMTYTRMFLNDGKVSDREILSSHWISEMEKGRISYRTGQSYGYGLMNEDLEGFTCVGHSGGLTGVSSFFGFSRESDLGVVVLCNTGGVPVKSVGIAALRMAHEIYPDYKLGSYTEGTWTEETLSNTLGVYKSQEGDIVAISEEEGKMKIVVGLETLNYKIVNSEVLLLENKLEESYCRILRHSNGIAWGIYRGVRILPRVSFT
jgi:CubicO group peptidase (beta-lactamase class C family)